MLRQRRVSMSVTSWMLTRGGQMLGPRLDLEVECFFIGKSVKRFLYPLQHKRMRQS